MSIHIATAALWSLLLFAQRPSSAEFVIVTDGRSAARIVVGEKEPASPVFFAAQELQRYLKAMSGATLPIVKETTGQPAMILTVDAALADSAASPAVGKDRYRIQVSDQRIDLVGASPRATLFATYDLLERLGCGWCVPGDDTVPRRATVSIAEVKVDTTPAFPYRMMLDYPLMSVAQSLALVDWLAKNRMNWVHPCENAMGEPKLWYERRNRVVPELRKRGLHLIFGGHTMPTWLPPEYTKEHPDWFAYVDGERQPPSLCLTNAEMTEELIRNLRRFLDRCPEIEVVDLWHPDLTPFCHCPACTQGLVPAEAKGKRPEAVPDDAVQSAYVINYVRFINQVAQAVGQSHPPVMISPLIYGVADRAMPDGCPALADNVLIGLAHIRRDSYYPLAGEPKSAANLRFLGNDLTWMAKSKHHFIYEYYHCWRPPFVYPGAQVIVQDLWLLKILGSQGTCSDMWGYTPCNMYVAARALWSPDISWEAAVRDFHARYYGEVGKEMADNEIQLTKGLFGLAGYQSGYATKSPDQMAEAGRRISEARPRQIAFLEGLIARTKDSLVKTRLERALKPWKLWDNEEARWWAFPAFEEKDYQSN